MKLALFLLLFGNACAALAHPGHDAGLLHGLAHPFTGIDHLLAMVLVGVWAARCAGWSRLLLPCAFVGSMLAGTLIPFALPAVEPMILASVIVFFAALLFAARVPPVPSALLVALFGLFHGYAHLAEIPQGDSAPAFAAGMVIGTAMLHAVGFVIGAKKTPAAVVLATGDVSRPAQGARR